MIRKFSDQPIAGDTVQILTKPTPQDYQDAKGFKFTNDGGLVVHDLR